MRTWLRDTEQSYGKDDVLDSSDEDEEVALVPKREEGAGDDELEAEGGAAAAGAHTRPLFGSK
jgi:hypothetical protein